MPTLRKKLLKLAYQIPETRIHLIPLLRKAVDLKNKCFLYAGALAATDPSLTLIKGPPFQTGETAHFFLKNKDGDIIDPTAKQYDSPYPFYKAPENTIVNIQKNLETLKNDPHFEELPQNLKTKILKTAEAQQKNFKAFLHERYKDGLAEILNPDPENRKIDRMIQVRSALKYPPFKTQIAAEYKAWLGTGVRPDKPKFPKGVISKNWSYDLQTTATDTTPIQDLLSSALKKPITTDTLVKLTGLPFAGLKIKPQVTSNGRHIKVSNQGWVSSMLRTFEVTPKGEAVIHNDLIKIDKSKSPPNTGARIFANQVAEASELGFNRIECFAMQDPPEFNGGIVWPKLGYDGIVPIKNIPEELEELMLDKGAEYPYKFSDLMRIPGGPEWWEENAEDFDGTFDLTPGSYSMKTLQNYVEKKAKLEGYKTTEEWLTASKPTS